MLNTFILVGVGAKIIQLAGCMILLRRKYNINSFWKQSMTDDTGVKYICVRVSVYRALTRRIWGEWS
jgi:hypothetical protein